MFTVTIFVELCLTFFVAMFVFIFVTVFVTMFSLAAPANYGSYWIYLDLRLTR